MEKTGREYHRFGLVGKNISYSFSRDYFTKKFAKLELPDHSYENFDLGDIFEFPELIDTTNKVIGLNVTIPYKEAVIPYLDQLEASARKIGAVNTIKISPSGLIGYNTDAYGFQKSIERNIRKEVVQYHHLGYSMKGFYKLSNLVMNWGHTASHRKNALASLSPNT